MRARTLPPLSLMVGFRGLPKDFRDRLNRLKEASGLTWEGMAECLDVEPRQLQRWRGRTVPSGETLFALFRLAARVPGGVYLLLGEDVSPPY